MHVTLIDHMGTDLSVVNAARVSFDKQSGWDWDGVELVLHERDRKLLRYLAAHGHWSPFTHVTVSLRVKAPIFVARQLAKHQVGLSWNEVSRRYVDSTPEFYTPWVWRKKAENVKQGSSVEVVPDRGIPWSFDTWTEAYESHLQDSKNLYDSMIVAGICPEQARMVLPQSAFTEWVWTGSLYAFHRVCVLRLDSHTQRETQEVAKQIDAICAKIFPESWAALNGVNK